MCMLFFHAQVIFFVLYRGVNKVLNFCHYERSEIIFWTELQLLESESPKSILVFAREERPRQSVGFFVMSARLPRCRAPRNDAFILMSVFYCASCWYSSSLIWSCVVQNSLALLFKSDIMT